MVNRLLTVLVLIFSAAAAWYGARAAVPPPDRTRGKPTLRATSADSGSEGPSERPRGSALPSTGTLALEQPNMDGPPANFEAVNPPAPIDQRGLADGPPNDDVESPGPPGTSDGPDGGMGK